MKGIFFIAALSAVLLFAGCLEAKKENASTVYGNVLYNGSLPVKGAEVIVLCDSNKKSAVGVTDQTGYYSVKLVCAPQSVVKASARSGPTEICIKDKCRDVPGGIGENNTIISEGGYGVINLNLA